MRIALRILLGYFAIVALAALLLTQVFVAQVKPGVRQTMEDTLVEVRSAAVKAIADRKALERRVTEARFGLEDWERKAELAVAKGKEDLARIYFGAGIEYVDLSATPFYSFPWKLLFRSYGHHDSLFYLLCAALMLALVSKAPVLTRKYAAVLGFNLAFFVLHLSLRSFVNSHHFYFLTAPFLLALVIGRDVTGNAFPIPETGVHLGRERGDVLFPEDGYVSGLHCRLSWEPSSNGQGGRLMLTDLGSSNGSFLRLREETDIKSGDVLLMGQQLFRVAV